MSAKQTAARPSQCKRHPCCFSGPPVLWPLHVPLTPAHRSINQLTAAGKAVLLVSSELPELIGMSDRILMLREGRVGGTFSREEATQEKLMHAAMAA